MAKLIIIAVSSCLVSNVVLSQFLGICSFVGVSTDVKTSAGMGGAVVFVITLASAVASLIYNYVLTPLGITYLKTIVFIVVIAALVQIVEMFMHKCMVSLYNALGVYLPLITTNCAVLGVALLVVQKEMNLLESVIYAGSIAIGFTLALVIFAGIREQMELTGVPKGMKGVPIALVTAGILAMAFMGFSGLVPLP